jgi:hypothetical protein
MSLIGRSFLFVVLSVFCLWFVGRGQAQRSGAQGILTGVVADNAENAPIPYAFVYVHGGYRKARFDASVPIEGAGRFRVTLTPGLYDVFVAAAGFAPTCTVVSIRPARVTHFEPRLKPDLAHSQD